MNLLAVFLEISEATLSYEMRRKFLLTAGGDRTQDS